MGLRLRKILIILALLFFSVLPSYADTRRDEAMSMFHNGIELYKSENFAESAKMFEQILDKGIRSGAIYFNLGNAYAKNGDTAPARLAYERALRYIPRDTAVRNNLAYVASRLEDKIKLPRPQWWRQVLYAPAGIMNHKELGFVLIGSFMLIMLIWALMTLFTSYKALLKTGLIFSCVFFIWIGAVFCVKIHTEKFSRNAVIMAEEAAVRWGNTDNDKVAFFLHAGTKVVIRQTRDNWVLITIGDGKSGWVKKSFLEII
ncbi:MAG: tetratricopeptide repeat protein [Candidatus Auribacterota bacterium]